MNVELLIQLLVNGVIVGTLYGVVAMSFVLIYKATQVVNFAQGEFLLIGAWVCWWLLTKYQLPFYIGMPVTLVFMFVFGVALQVVILRPLIGEPIISVIMVTIGLSASLDSRFEGAAALDAEGALIGMVLFGPRRRPLVIPASTIDRVAPVLAEKGHVARGYLGAGLHPVRDAALSGAIVMSLDEKGPAKSAGLVVGDVITAWSGEPVHGPRDVIRKLGSDSVGTTVTLSILRGGAAQTTRVTLGERPAA